MASRRRRDRGHGDPDAGPATPAREGPREQRPDGQEPPIGPDGAPEHASAAQDPPGPLPPLPPVPPPHVRDLVQYMPEHNVVLCKECRHAVQWKRLPHHLRSQHGLPPAAAATVIDALPAAARACTGKVAACHPPDGRPAIPGLKLLKGYMCNACAFRTMSHVNLRKHYRSLHGGLGAGVNRFADVATGVTMQTLYEDTRSVQLFVVSEPVAPDPDREEPAALPADAEARVAWLTARADEPPATRDLPSQPIAPPPVVSMSNSFLDRMGWTAMLQGMHFPDLRAAAAAPGANVRAAARRDDPDTLPVLRRVHAAAVDLVVEAHDVAAGMDHFLRRVLGNFSEGNQVSLKGFARKDGPTVKRYADYWARALVFLIRTCLFGWLQRDGDDGPDGAAPAFDLAPDRFNLALEVLNAAAAGDAPGAAGELRDAVLALSMKLLFAEVLDERSEPVAFYAGAACVSQDQGFATPNECSSLLYGLVTVAQALLAHDVTRRAVLRRRAQLGLPPPGPGRALAAAAADCDDALRARADAARARAVAEAIAAEAIVLGPAEEVTAVEPGEEAPSPRRPPRLASLASPRRDRLPGARQTPPGSHSAVLWGARSGPSPARSARPGLSSAAPAATPVGPTPAADDSHRMLLSPTTQYTPLLAKATPAVRGLLRASQTHARQTAAARRTPGRQQPASVPPPRKPTGAFDCIRARLSSDCLLSLQEELEAQSRAYLRNTSRTVVSHLLVQCRFAMVCSEEDVSAPKVSWCETNAHSPRAARLVFEDVSLSLDGLSGMALGELERAERLLAGDLLLGEPPEGADAAAAAGVEAELRRLLPHDVLYGLWDRIGEHRPGYNYVDEPNAGLSGLRDLAARRAAASPRLLAALDGVAGPDAAFLRRYLASQQRFLESLMLLFYFCGGMPPRGTELLSISAYNHATERDVFVRPDGVAMFVTRYNKTQARTTQSKATPRFLPPRVTRLLTLYLAAVDPAVRAVRARLGLPCARPADRRLLFSEDGRLPWPADRLYDAVNRLGRRHLARASFGVRVWRQMAKAVAHRFLPRGAEERRALGFADDDAGLHRQFGHTAAAGARLYGQERSGMCNGLAPRAITVMECFSLAYHGLLLLTGDEPAGGAGAGDGGDPAPPPTRRPRPAPGGVDDAALADALRRLYGAGAGFRSAEQGVALRVVTQTTAPAAVVVLPTAGGKSALFMVPALAEREGVTVVVLPFVSLVQDVARRCGEAGVACQVWLPAAPGDPDPTAEDLRPPLVVVSADRAASRPFLTAMELAGDAVRRVVLDECHVLLSQSDFRPRLAGLAEVAARARQTVLLTGTLPPRMQAPLLAALRQDAWYLEPATVRAATTRPNLEYSVMRCADAADADARIRRLLADGLGGPADDGKAVVYCHTRHQANDLARALGCAAYHSQAGGRADALDAWVGAGAAPWPRRAIVATSALGCGVDAPGVRLVLHRGTPRMVLDYAQESGRAGRGGEPARCTVLTWPRDAAPGGAGRGQGEGAEDSRAAAAEVAALMSGARCRRAVLAECMDGPAAGAVAAGGCAAVRGAAPCDVCGAQAVAREQRHGAAMAARMTHELRTGTPRTPAAALTPPQRALQREALGLRGFGERVRWLRDRGCCLFCLMLDDFEHPVGDASACQQARLVAMSRALKRDCDFPTYHACFLCGLPPGLCSKWPSRGRPRSNDCDMRAVGHDLLALTVLNCPLKRNVPAVTNIPAASNIIAQCKSLKQPNPGVKADGEKTTFAYLLQYDLVMTNPPPHLREHWGDADGQ